MSLLNPNFLPVVYGLLPFDECNWRHLCEHYFKVQGLAIWSELPTVVRQVRAGSDVRGFNVDLRFFGLCLSFEDLKPLASLGKLPKSLLQWRVCQPGEFFQVTLSEPRPMATMAIWGVELRE